MSSKRLSDAQLTLVPASVRRPMYNRGAQRVGIVHFGIGTFHRAHQAMYTDDAMNAGDAHWAILGVSLRSPEVRNALLPQDALYSLSQRDGSREDLRIIGSVRNVLVAQENARAITDALGSPHVHVVTLTVTEKGYWCDPSTSSLLLNAVDLAHDLEGRGAPRTIYGFLEHAFVQRRAAGLRGLSLVSCDNLAENGRLLANLLNEYLEHRDPSLAEWARREVLCPSTMVDRIVPATTAADLEHISDLMGIEDRGAVVTEPFTQWVIEDCFVGPRPKWEIGGAQFTRDVRPFETAKLRMLNGAHSTIAYVGLLLGLQYVHQAILDADLRTLVERVMKREAAASLAPVKGQDLARYADALLQRFENPSLRHRLVQIAMDGTLKIPQRWLTTIGILQERSTTATALLFAVAAWVVFVSTPGRALDDPLLTQLMRIREHAAGNARAIVDAIFGDQGLLSGTWFADANSARQITAHVESIRNDGMRASLRHYLASSSGALAG